ncbi:exonuclease V [Mycena sanguinolenta]|nr:exonuclease V [Mycena sanguinolenta]
MSGDSECEDSEYDVYDDFASLTQEDFACLDASVSSVLNPPVSDDSLPSSLPVFSHIDPAMPSLSIELEGSYPNAKMGSPIGRYRYRTGILSVTDLVSLAWCEVQFDYGLRQKRFRPLEHRPASFRAESGKEIVVQQEVAVRNDKTTKRGQFIHKELERELRPEEIQILITGEEERWALRLLNFLSSLMSLRAEGHAREIPVFGIVDGVIVVGIVDELLIREESDSLACPSPPSCEPEPQPGTKRASDSALPSPKRVCRSPSPTSCQPEAQAITALPQCIRVIDTKTRRKDSLPSNEDAEPAYLQVMLYHRLLARLIDTSALFDFSVLWTPLGVRPAAPFSVAFLMQATQILGSDDVPGCLDDVVALLRARLADLDLPRLDTTLQIIYRSQNKYPRPEGKGKSREDTAYIPVEDAELAKAIAMSLEDAFEAQLAAALKESAGLANALPALIFGPQATTCGLDQSVQGQGTVADLSLTSGPSTGTLGSDNDQAAAVLASEPTLLRIGANEDSPPPQDTVTVPARPEIIGTKDFTMDDEMLDTYLQNALDWWRGNRPARGVSEAQTNRCFSCEYRDGCEWREQKGLEKLEEARQRRALKGAMSW